MQDVLRMPVRVEAARQSQKLRTVTLDDRGKRAVVACPGETREPLVGLGTEKQFGEPDAHLLLRPAPHQRERSPIPGPTRNWTMVL